MAATSIASARVDSAPVILPPPNPERENVKSLAIDKINLDTLISLVKRPPTPTHFNRLKSFVTSTETPDETADKLLENLLNIRRKGNIEIQAILKSLSGKTEEEWIEMEQDINAEIAQLQTTSPHLFIASTPAPTPDELRAIIAHSISALRS